MAYTGLEGVHTRIARERLYHKGIPIPTKEMPREIFLSHLKQQERRNLVELLKRINSAKSRTRGEAEYGVLAVGTTTYDDEYWNGLKEYLKERKDTKHAKYIAHRGEDIDLILTPVNSRNITYKGTCSWSSFIEVVRENGKTLGDKVILEGDGRKNGTHYLSIPEEFQKKYKKSIIRMKSKAYGNDSMIVKYKGCRSFHLDFNDIVLDEKLKQERVENAPFCFLTTNYDISDLELAVLWGEKTGTFTNLTPDAVGWSEVEALKKKLKIAKP